MALDTRPQTSLAPPPAVRMTGIHKHFAGVHALRGADFELVAGECHALIGANGAGKSTLGKILGGSLVADSGNVSLFGEDTLIRTPHDGMAAGVGMVPQEPLLAHNMTVAENIMMGREAGGWTRVDHRAIVDASARLLARVGLAVDPRTPMNELDIAAQQLVQVARALGCDARVLILDEPTSAITAHECEALFALVDDLRESGVTIIYVSHRLPEVFRLAQRVSVMRDGLTVRTLQTSATDEDELIAIMAGAAKEDLQQVAESPRESAAREGVPLLEAVELSEEGALADVSFRLWPGEILGIAGLVGSGRSELARALAGLDPLDRGAVLLEGESISVRSAGQAQRRGIVLLPEDRKALGLIPQLTVRENISLSITDRLSGFAGRISPRRERELADKYRDLLSIQCSSVEQIVGELSGGNQQKVLLARVLASEPKALILDEPTRGVDVSAKADIHRWIRALAAEGMSILLISSELEEVVALSDRILITRDGRLVHEMEAAGATEEGVLGYAARD